MRKGALASATLLAALPAAAQDWVEIAGYGGTGDNAVAFMFVDASRIQDLGSRQFSAPYLEVTRKNYVERTLTVSCGIKLEWAASKWRDRSGRPAFDASPSSAKLVGSAAGAMGGLVDARLTPPRKQDLLLGRWMCDRARPVGGVQFIRRASDPKAAAWAVLDANHARLPGEVNADLARVTPLLTYTSPRETYGVRSLRVEGCDLKLVTSTGLGIRLLIRYLLPQRRGETRLVFTNVRTDVTVTLSGMPVEFAGRIHSGLTALKSDC